MKKIFGVVVLLLAINFLAAAGAVGWLFQSGHLDKDKLGQLKDIVFPTTAPSTATTEPSADTASTQPTLRLDDLLARQ